MQNLKYCTKQQIQSLIDLKAPLMKVTVNDYMRAVYYTKDPFRFPECDAYYYPYLDEIAKWLREEKEIKIIPMLTAEGGWIFYCRTTIKGAPIAKIAEPDLNWDNALSNAIDLALTMLKDNND